MLTFDLHTAPPSGDRRRSHIRTFHPRRGRLSPRHRRALTQLWPRYGVEFPDGVLEPAEVFGRRAPVVLEIGSGMGDTTAAIAADHPTHDFLAVDVHTPGVANLLALIDDAGLTNVRVVHGDALVLLPHLPPARLDGVLTLFPDPWPKRRHHKRRLFTPERVAMLRSRLAPGGCLHVATDWAEYAEAIRETLTADPGLVNAHPGWAPRPQWRPVTKFERRAIAEGRRIYELTFQRR